MKPVRVYLVCEFFENRKGLVDGLLLNFSLIAMGYCHINIKLGPYNVNYSKGCFFRKFFEAGQKIGNIDDSGVTSGPHLHLARYTAGELATWWHSDRGTCDWGLAGWDAPDLDPGEDPYN